MKKSTKVTLTIVAVVGLASCNRRRYDPCESGSFNEMACQDAVRGGGYYYNGGWVPMRYSRPYPYYYDSYRTYLGHGGTVHSMPGQSYSRPSTSSSPSSSSSSHGVERGGFGSSGGAHGAGE